MIGKESDSWDSPTSSLCPRLVRWKHRSVVTESKQREHALMKRRKAAQASEKPPSKEIIPHDYIDSIHVHRPWTVSGPTMNMDTTTDRTKGFKPPLLGPKMISIQLGLEYDVPTSISQKGRNEIRSFNIQRMTKRKEVAAKHVVDAFYDTSGQEKPEKARAFDFAGYAPRSSPREYPFLSHICTRKDELVHLTYDPSFTVVEKRVGSTLLGSKKILRPQRKPSHLVVDNLVLRKEREAGLENCHTMSRREVSIDRDHRTPSSFPHESRFAMASPRTLGRGVEREIGLLREHSKRELLRAKKMVREKQKHDKECQKLKQQLKQWGKSV